MRVPGSSSTGWLALALLLSGAAAWAEPDDAQQAWLAVVDVAPSWDNVRGGAAWVQGQEPVRRPGGSFHTVQLQPTEGVTVRLPAGERLRLDSPQGTLHAGDLDIAWSNGSGLFTALVPAATADGRTLLATPPPGAEALVRVQRRADAQGPIELALFVSRNPNRVVATSYRESLTPSAAGRRVRVDERTGGDDFWLADRDNPLQLQVDGPTRVRIDSRLLFPAEDGPYADSYRINAHLNGEPWRVFDLTTLLETGEAVAVDGCSRPVGRPAFAYLDLPDGPARLELRVQRPMLLRLLARQQPDDYLYPGNRVKDGGTTGTYPGHSAYREAVRVAQDNAYSLGGMRAVQVLNAWAARYPAQAQYQSLAVRERLLHSFYRDLMPQRATQGGASLFAWFHTPQLQGKSDDVYLPAGYAQSLAGNLASGYFSEVPPADAEPQVFLVPEEIPAGQLRVAVDLGGLAGATAFSVQMDEAAPVRLWAEPRRALPATEFQPTNAAAALAVLEDQHRDAAATLSGPFASRRAAAPLADVGFAEIPLERPVKRLKVWRADTASGPLRVALAYRTSGWFQMSESGYLDLLAAVGAKEVQRLMQGALSRLPRGVAGATAPATGQQDDRVADLRNQWLPLLRLLHSRYAVFAAGVEKRTGDRKTAEPHDPSAIGRAVQEAEAAESDGQWQMALERWSSLQGTAEGTVRLRARARQIHALQMLGSGFLATQLLRHDLLHAAHADQRRQALQQLVELAVAEEDLELVLTLRTVAAILDPAAVNLERLADALAATGRSRFALQVLLAVPPDQRSADVVLGLAYDLGWWRLFDETVSGLADPQRQASWRGYRAQLKGDFPEALSHWQAAGQRGQALAGHLTAGLDIRRGLGSPDADSRMRSVLAWETWQRSTPGPTTWRAIPQAVIAHAGTRSIVAVAQGDYGDRFQATPGRPVRVAVYGPLELRFGVRPLHPTAAGEPINDWLRIGTADGVEHHPIVDNTVSADLRLAPDGGRRPGREVDVVQQVPAGYHELELSAEQSDLLVQVSALEPRFPLAVLPPLTPHTARQALAGGASFTRPTPARGAVEVEVVKGCRTESTIPLSAVVTTADGGPAQAPVGAPSAAWFQALDGYRARHTAAGPLPVGRQGLAGAAPSLKQRLIRLLWEAEQTPARYEDALTRAEHLAEAEPRTPGVEPILRRLRRYAGWELVRTAQESAGVRLIEFAGWQPESPELRARKAVMALDAPDEEVVAGHDAHVLDLHNKGPVEIGLRLSMVDAAYRPAQPMRVLIGWDDRAETEVRLSATKPEVTLVEKVGAGDHALRIRIAEPLSDQFLRIRVDERRVDAAQAIAKATPPKARQPVRAQPQKPGAGSGTRRPRGDSAGTPVRTAQKSTGALMKAVAGRPAAAPPKAGKAALALPSGGRQVTPGQDGKSGDRPPEPSRVIAEPAQRSYMVVTREQPLVLLLQGPTRLRIDEWRDGGTRVSYRMVDAGWQRVAIQVPEGRDEAVVRVFRRTVEPGRPTPASRQSVYEPKPVKPAKPIDVRVLPPAPAIQVSDMRASALPAGDLPPAALPGDGTWSLTGGFTSRRLVDDEPQAGGGAEQFFFVGATYRWFDERQDIYYQADGFVRLHEHGDPALALHGVVSVRKPDWLVDLDVAGSLFLQHVDASGEVETAAALEARISRSLELGDKVSHRPSLAVFQRWLSLDGLPADAPETVDQDIYSRYKDDHGRGLRVGDRIQYRPWLDTVLFAGAHLVSNEDLDLTDPDHLLLEIGARQLIGDFDLGARYSHFQYYEDDDRERDSDTQRLWIDVGFSRWLSPYRGVQADLSYVYDSQSGDSSVFLSVSLNLGKGRYYEDYRPGDLDFRSIRQRRALERQASEERQ